MKTRLLLLLSCVFLISCTQIKENRMEKDTDELIEASKKCKGFSSLNVISVAVNSIQYKYQGADYIKFMQILRNKVLEMTKKGEDCGSLELMYIMDKDFQKIDKKSD